METLITSFIGLDVHKDSIAIGLAAAGREAYFPSRQDKPGKGEDLM